MDGAPARLHPAHAQAPRTRVMQGPFKPPRHVRTTVEEQSSLQGSPLNLGTKSGGAQPSSPPTPEPALAQPGQSSQYMLLAPLVIGLVLICLRRQYRLMYAAAHLD